MRVFISHADASLLLLNIQRVSPPLRYGHRRGITRNDKEMDVIFLLLQSFNKDIADNNLIS